MRRCGSYCAACYQHPTDGRMIDCEAAYDGPVLNEEGLQVMIDDLILCERCVRQMAGMIHMVDEDTDRVSRLAAELAAEREAREGLERYADSLEGAVAFRPADRPNRPGRKQQRPEKVAA